MRMRAGRAIIMVGVGSLLAARGLLGCASHPEPSAPNRAGSQKDDEPTAATPGVPSAGAPNAKSEPHRGTLAPAPASLAIGQFWPTRICTRGPGVIVVASNCVCDSKMTCSVARRGGTFDLHVGMSQEICKDCGTFMALCSVPTGSSGKTFKIAIDGKPVLDKLPIPRGDGPATEQCYE